MPRSRYLRRGRRSRRTERTRRHAPQLEEGNAHLHAIAGPVANLLERVGLEMEEGKRRGSAPDGEGKEDGRRAGAGSRHDTERVRWPVQ